MNTEDRGQTLTQRSLAVRRNFISLKNSVYDQAPPCPVSAADITDALERFILWAGNLGALRESTSKLSLEHRLSEAPEIRRQIHKHFDYLLEAIDDLSLLTQGEHPNDDADSDSGYDEARINLELISESLRTLFRIAVLVRQAAPGDRFSRALRSSHSTFPALFDIDHVGHKHPKVQDQEKALALPSAWQCDRIETTVHQVLRDHKARLAANEVDVAAGQDGGATTVLQSSKATTLQPDKVRLDLDEDDDTLSFMSASTATEALSTLKLPRLADLSVNDQPFECPICFTLQSIKKENTWKVHAFRDLKPYVCTVGGTECETELFGQSDAWFNHELEHHRSQYECSLCSHKSFSSRSDMASHIIATHGKFPEHQLRVLEDAGRKPPVTFKAKDCPFCDDWAAALLAKERQTGKAVVGQDVLVTVKRFKRHVAAHQEQLAIFAIPRATEDNDGGSADLVGSLASTIRSEADSLRIHHSDNIVKIATYTFKWNKPAEEVYVTGTFDDWRKSVKLEKSDSGFEKTVTLPDSTEKIFYKFVVDGLGLSTNQHLEKRILGNVNNVLSPRHVVAQEGTQATFRAEEEQFEQAGLDDISLAYRRGVTAIGSEPTLAFKTSLQEELGWLLEATARWEKLSRQDEQRGWINEVDPDVPNEPVVPSSYWSVSEANEFSQLLRSFGTDWLSIALHMRTKTPQMVYDYYMRQVVDGGRADAAELKAIATDADLKKVPKKRLPPPPAKANGRRHATGHATDPRAKLSQEKTRNQGDMLLFRYHKNQTTEHFPANSIAEGTLLVGQLRRLVQVDNGLSDRQAERVHMLFKGKMLKDDSEAVRSYGIQSNSTVFVIYGDSSSEDSAEESIAENSRGKTEKKARIQVEGENTESGTADYRSYDSPTDPRTQDYHRMKVSALKAELGRRGLPPDGRKDELIERLMSDNPAPLMTETTNQEATRNDLAQHEAPTEQAEVSASSSSAMVKLENIRSHFTTALLPLCVQFTTFRPANQTNRENEHRKLSETIMQQVILKLDAVDLAGDLEARQRRSELVKQVQEVLGVMDRILLDSK